MTSLLVSNQSFDINPVDITVVIDGDVQVRDDFDVEGDQPPQHNWKRYGLKLPEGSHELVATSVKGMAEAHTGFEVAGDLTITIAYWYDRSSGRSETKGHFTVEIGSGPAATM